MPPETAPARVNRAAQAQADPDPAAPGSSSPASPAQAYTPPPPPHPHAPQAAATPQAGSPHPQAASQSDAQAAPGCRSAATAARPPKSGAKDSHPHRQAGPGPDAGWNRPRCPVAGRQGQSDARGAPEARDPDAQDGRSAATERQADRPASAHHQPTNPRNTTHQQVQLASSDLSLRFALVVVRPQLPPRQPPELLRSPHRTTSLLPQLIRTVPDQLLTLVPTLNHHHPATQRISTVADTTMIASNSQSSMSCGSQRCHGGSALM